MQILRDIEHVDTINDALRTVSQRGWAHLDVPRQSDVRSFMLQIANLIGHPRGMRKKHDVLDKLFVMENAAAFSNSLSRIHGTGEFPLHTDTAHWATPCRYLILGCGAPGRGERGTLLLNWRDIGFSESKQRDLCRAVFRVQNGARSFFGTIVSPSKRFVRFDMGCMAAVDSFSIEVKDEVLIRLQAAQRHRIAWFKNLVFIIDNWTVLHGRENCDLNDDDRMIYRILVQ